MVSAHAGVEAILVVAGIGVFAVYHLWALKLKQVFSKDPYWHDYFASGKMARLLWAQACMKSGSQGILAVQTIRNAEMAVRYEVLPVCAHPHRYTNPFASVAFFQFPSNHPRHPVHGVHLARV
jgi:hypothetical protein